MRYLFLILLLLIPNYAFASEEQRIIYLQHNALRNEKIQNGNFRIYSDKELIEDAQKWANYLAKNYKTEHKNIAPHSNSFQTQSHSLYNENQWENIAWWKPSMSLNRAFILWAEEEKNYYPQENKCRGVCGHYTQIVREKSKFVWCAQAQSKNNYGQWVVCRYSPAGNYVNKKPYQHQQNFSNPLYAKIILSIENIEKLSKKWKKINKQLEKLFIKFDSNKDKEKLLKYQEKISPIYNKIIKKKKLSINDYIVIQLYYRVQLELYGK